MGETQTSKTSDQQSLFIAPCFDFECLQIWNKAEIKNMDPKFQIHYKKTLDVRFFKFACKLAQGRMKTDQQATWELLPRRCCINHGPVCDMLTAMHNTWSMFCLEKEFFISL